jgi:hypothetical protein
LAEACNNGAGGAGGGLHANLVGSTSTGLAGAERVRDALNEYLGNMVGLALFTHVIHVIHVIVQSKHQLITAGMCSCN